VEEVAEEEEEENDIKKINAKEEQKRIDKELREVTCER
jgi:hypothetical protein